MATAETQAQTAVNPCPRCGKPLTDAAGLGWCAACGYCRSLEETAGHAKEAFAKPEPVAASKARPAAATKVPMWLFPLVLGMGAIAWISFSAGRRLPPDSFERALWTSIQIGAGILILLVGQFVALLRLAPSDEKLGFKDVLLPFRLYGHVFRRISAMQLTVWTLGWSVSAIACALIFVGGLGHWFTYLKKDKPTMPVINSK